MNQTTFPQIIARMDADRLRRYRDNLDFYTGAQWPGRARSGERRLTFNYTKTVVDKVTSYLMSGMTTIVEPADSSPESTERARRAQDALRQVYEQNHLEALDLDTELDAAILGDGAYKVTWDSHEQRVRVSAPDVQGLFAWWVADDPSQVWRVASRYRLSAEEATMLHGVESPRKQHVTMIEAWSDEVFQLWAENTLVQERPNPYGVIPFVLFPNLRVPKAF